MTFKRCKVVMLSANTKSNIWKKSDGNLDYFPTKVLLPHPELGESQHLYIISDDEIKKGDFYYTKAKTKEYAIHKAINKRIVKIANEDFETKKIIATTDKSLVILCPSCEGSGRVDAISEEEYDACLTCSGGSLGYFPQPSKVFIEKYCKVGGIDEIMVEYLKTDGKLPKTSDNNTIIIRKVKDSWTKEELSFMKGTSNNHIEWIYQRMLNVHGENPQYDYMSKLKEISNWVKENL